MAICFTFCENARIPATINFWICEECVTNLEVCVDYLRQLVVEKPLCTRHCNGCPPAHLPLYSHLWTQLCSFSYSTHTGLLSVTKHTHTQIYLSPQCNSTYYSMYGMASHLTPENSSFMSQVELYFSVKSSLTPDH